MTIAGIFVGGKALRMGGAAKGLLVAPSGETIVARWVRLLHGAGVEVVLVGAHTGAAYASLGLRLLRDQPEGIGPLGGLAALLDHAADSPVLAVACDMPHATESLVARLLAHAPEAPAVAPRQGGRWQPLFARYDAPRVRPVVQRLLAGGTHALSRVLDEAGAAELPVEPEEWRALDDWDTKEQIERR